GCRQEGSGKESSCSQEGSRTCQESCCKDDCCQGSCRKESCSKNRSTGQEGRSQVGHSRQEDICSKDCSGSGQKGCRQVCSDYGACKDVRCKEGSNQVCRSIQNNRKEGCHQGSFPKRHHSSQESCRKESVHRSKNHHQQNRSHQGSRQEGRRQENACHTRQDRSEPDCGMAFPHGQPSLIEAGRRPGIRRPATIIRDGGFRRFFLHDEPGLRLRPALGLVPLRA